MCVPIVVPRRVALKAGKQKKERPRSSSIGTALRPCCRPRGSADAWLVGRLERQSEVCSDGCVAQGVEAPKSE